MRQHDALRTSRAATGKEHHVSVALEKFRILIGRVGIRRRRILDIALETASSDRVRDLRSERAFRAIGNEEVWLSDAGHFDGFVGVERRIQRREDRTESREASEKRQHLEVAGHPTHHAISPTHARSMQSPGPAIRRAVEFGVGEGLVAKRGRDPVGHRGRVRAQQAADQELPTLSFYCHGSPAAPSFPYGIRFPASARRPKDYAVAGLRDSEIENTILNMQNNDFSSENSALESPRSPSHASRAVERTLARHRAAYESEVRRLVEATLVLIERTGRLQPTVSDILRESGLSNQAFYKHFRSKDELFVAVLDEGMRILASYLDHQMSAAGDPRERVRAWLAGLLEQALNPDAAAATRPFTLSRDQLARRFADDVAESERQLTRLVAAAIRDGDDAGTMTSTNPERDAESLYHLGMGWIEARLRESVPPDREDAERLIEFALAGLTRGQA